MFEPVDTLACMLEPVPTSPQAALGPRKAHTSIAHPLEDRHSKIPEQALKVGMGLSE